MRTTGLDTIQPEAEKHYRMRNGAITGPMIEDKGMAALDKPNRFRTEEKIDGLYPMWRVDGRATFFGGLGDNPSNRPYDLMEEAPDGAV